MGELGRKSYAALEMMLMIFTGERGIFNSLSVFIIISIFLHTNLCQCEVDRCTKIGQKKYFIRTSAKSK